MKKKLFMAITAATLAVSMLAGCSASDTKGSSGTEVSSESEASALNEDEVKTIDSFTNVADGIYSIDFYADYKLDDYLASNITTVEDFDVWMTTNLTHGIPTGDIPDIGCSSFSVMSTDGDHLFGRNYDLQGGDNLVIRTAPKSGYASIGIVDLMHVNLGLNGEYEINDVNKPLLLAAPWCVCDGINEKGFGASILRLDDFHVVNDTSKDDLLLYSVIRVVLDKCASVDEALDLLDQYDLYSPSPYTYHFFFTDKTGRSVVVEFSDGETKVVDDTAVTNYMLSSGKSDTDMRYTKIHNRIDEVDSMTSDDAMGVLGVVSDSKYTRWSAVYNLDKYSLEVCFNTDYDNKYSFTGKIE